MSEWVPITIDSDMPKERPFLLSDEYGCVYVGETAFDFYEAKFWHPMPKYPYPSQIVTNDEWLQNLFDTTKW